MKLGQDVFLDEISDVFENGSFRVQDKVTRSNVRKTLCTLYRPDFRSDTHETWTERLS